MKETKTSAEKVVKEPKPKLMNIKLEKLHPFEVHPYKVLDDESMTELVESIKEYGLLNRIIVRPLEDKQDEYEIISGHRRQDLTVRSSIIAGVHRRILTEKKPESGKFWKTGIPFLQGT